MSPTERWGHVAAWLLILCFFVSAALEVGWPFWFSLATQSPYLLLYIVTFYAFLYKVCPWWHQNKILFFVCNTVGLGLFVSIYVFLDLTIPEYVLPGEAQPVYPLRIHISDATFVFIFIEIAVLGTYFQRYSISRIEANSKKAIELAPGRRTTASARAKLLQKRVQYAHHLQYPFSYLR